MDSEFASCMYKTNGTLVCRNTKQTNTQTAKRQCDYTHKEKFVTFNEVPSDRLQEGGVKFMSPGDRMYSGNRAYYLQFTIQGDLEIRRTSDNVRIWNAGVSAPYPLHAALQTQWGNFVLWAMTKEDLTGAGYDYWETPTRTLWMQGGTPPYLVMQNDGNLVLYTKNNVAAWASNSVDYMFPWSPNYRKYT